VRRIGGSDIPKLLGLSKYGNERDVYDRVVLGIEPEWSEIMERGAAVEPQLRAHAQRALGVALEDREGDIHQHPDNDFATCQVDDFATWNGTPIVVEYKSANLWVKGWGADGTDEIPGHVRAQIAWQLACTNRDKALVVVGFGVDEDPPAIFTLSNVCAYPVERDGVYESYILSVGRKFWVEHCLTKVPPIVAPLARKSVKRKPEEAANV
jgi:predicted phage-related endonuclease